MADKEATVYVVDVGASMREKHNGRNESDLEFAMTYVWDKITSTVSLHKTSIIISGVNVLRSLWSVRLQRLV